LTKNALREHRRRLPELDYQAAAADEEGEEEKKKKKTVRFIVTSSWNRFCAVRKPIQLRKLPPRLQLSQVQNITSLTAPKN